MTYYKNQADELGTQARYQDREDEQTKAIGQGLAAIAYALLEVAQAIRDSKE
ncbi:hypothetical protein ACFXG6_32930 [Streptomyces roseus]|uniref:hypothetical protein n=1 Tax=Streptomyces roseus TaxID=66430 RepID=UPI003684B955